MPKGLVRYQKCGVFHFLTFSCYRREPLLGVAGAYSVFERELEAVRRQYGFVVAGYVLMPEHVHLLLGEPLISSLSVALQALKQKTSRELKRKGDVRFWQRAGAPGAGSSEHNHRRWVPRVPRIWAPGKPRTSTGLFPVTQIFRQLVAGCPSLAHPHTEGAPPSPRFCICG